MGSGVHLMTAAASRSASRRRVATSPTYGPALIKSICGRQNERCIGPRLHRVSHICYGRGRCSTTTQFASGPAWNKVLKKMDDECRGEVVGLQSRFEEAWREAPHPDEVFNLFKTDDLGKAGKCRVIEVYTRNKKCRAAYCTLSERMVWVWAWRKRGRRQPEDVDRAKAECERLCAEEA